MNGHGERPESSYRGRRGRPPVDPAMRRMVLMAAGVSATVIFTALLWSGVRPGIGFGPPPVISAPATPLRVSPADPGGLTVPGANEQIMSGDESAAAPQLAPPAPAPDLSQLDGKPPPVATPQAPPATMPAAPPANAPPVGNVQVQMAATVDEAGVKRAWSQLQVKIPSLLINRKPLFLPAVVAGQNIWRLRVGGFADDTAARAFCAQAEARGAACTVAGF